jgi:hypothetical protein
MAFSMRICASIVWGMWIGKCASNLGEFNCRNTHATKGKAERSITQVLQEPKKSWASKHYCRRENRGDGGSDYHNGLSPNRLPGAVLSTMSLLNIITLSKVDPIITSSYKLGNQVSADSTAYTTPAVRK